MHILADTCTLWLLVAFSKSSIFPARTLTLWGLKALSCLHQASPWDTNYPSTLFETAPSSLVKICLGSRGQWAAEITAFPIVKLPLELHLESSKAGYDMMKGKERVGESKPRLVTNHQTHLGYSTYNPPLIPTYAAFFTWNVIASVHKKMILRVWKSPYPDSPHRCHDLHAAVWSGHIEGPHILEPIWESRDTVRHAAAACSPWHHNLKQTQSQYVLQQLVSCSLEIYGYQILQQQQQNKTSVFVIFETENMVNKKNLNNFNLTRNKAYKKT